MDTAQWWQAAKVVVCYRCGNAMDEIEAVKNNRVCIYCEEEIS